MKTAAFLLTIFLLSFCDCPIVCGYQTDEENAVEAKVDRAWAIYDKGNIKLANQQLEKLEPELERVFGKGSFRLAMFFVNLSGSYSDVGEIAKSKKLLSKAKRIYKKLIAAPDAKPEVFFRYGGYLNNEGVTALGQGEIHRGIELLNQCLQLHLDEKVPKDNDTKSQLASLYGNLGLGYQKLNQLEKAEKSIAEGVAIDRSLLDGSKQKKHYLVESLSNLGVVQQRLGKPKLSKATLFEAVNMLPKNHQLRLTILPNLTTVCLTLNENETARRLAEECLTLATKEFGEKPNELLAKATSNFAFVHRKQKNYSDAFELAIKAEKIRTGLAERLVRTLTEPEAINYCVSNFGLPGLVVSLKAENSDLSTNATYQSVCLRDGLVHRMLVERNANRKQILQKHPKQNSRLKEVGLELCSVEKNEAQRNVLFEEREAILRRLLQANPRPEARPATPSNPIKKLSQLLPRQSAFIDIVQFEKSGLDVGRDFESTIQYAAFVILPNEREVLFALLGSADKLDKAGLNWLQKINTGEGVEAGRKISSAIWEPIKQLLPQETNKIYLCSDGALGQIPWPAFHNLDNAKPDYIVRNFSFINIADHKDLISRLEKNNHQHCRMRNTLCVTDIDFKKWQKMGQGLPTVKPVKDKIKAILENLGGNSTTQLSGANATVELVEEKIKTNDLVIFFSHADFIKQKRPRVLRTPNAFLKRGANRYLLAKSSLFLAYPQKLSGQFIADMSFEQPKHVVLIGCGTGAGELVANEGVSGFHLAFARAGAESTIATLWNVNEEVAIKFLECYLKALSKNRSVSEAFRNAQLSLLDGKGDYKLPKHWATWSIVGSMR